MNFSDSKIYKHLTKLVGFDTQNPPRKIDQNSDIFKYLSDNLTGFNISFIDAGDGCLSMLAVRGEPDLLFNFHIDTVPIAEGWNSNPHQLEQQDSKVVGLGACDIKGASACMLSAVNQTSGDVALLFSSDEEHGSSQAIKKFLTTEHGFQQVVVAEPTLAKAVVAHRGIQTATAFFEGIPGHASEARAFNDNAIHKAGKWISSALNWVSEQTNQVENLSGLPFNIGTIDGGVKANMIASSCELKFGFRTLPGQDSQTIISALNSLSKNKEDMKIEPGFFGPCLPASNQNYESSISNAIALAKHLNVEKGDAVNFWTEASLFSQAGLTAVVYGPGNIAQAHTANEWVDIKQLEMVEKSYINYLNQ
ncbi:MAG: acetylornithine deacetylase [Gammaproteobacteria bacterium]|nr:MAG: acetylornithine deacetylase [Gammaproteobacteria bacterium]